MALLHGLYDVFSDTLFGIIIAAFGYIVLIVYLVQGNKKGSAAEDNTSSVKNWQKIWKISLIFFIFVNEKYKKTEY